MATKTRKTTQIATKPRAKAPLKAEPKQETILEEVAEVIAPHKMLRLKPYVFALILIITGVIGLFAAFELTVDKIHVLKDPSYHPIFNINPVFSCKSVMQSNQAEVAGIPNTMFGLIGFSMVIAIGAAILAGAKFHKRFWQLWMLGMAAGAGMMLYLMYQSIYRLGTLCLFCMTTWAVLLPLIWYSLLWNLQHGNIPTPKRLEGLVRFMRRDHLSILVLIYLVLIFLIVNHFWYYFKTL
jgi:uncharacterized membrane protein